MDPDFLGIEQITDADRAYQGSRFSEVEAAIFANPYQRVWGAAGEPPLPMHAVTLTNMLHGFLPGKRPSAFRRATERAVDSHADLRWGPDRKGYRRLLHPNAVCLTGRWRITEDTGCSGYWRKGSEALIVGRYSTCCTETRRGHTRAPSLVGKLYPTTDPNHAEPLRTASFFTMHDIAGDWYDYINEVELRSAPNTTVLRRGLGIPIILLTGLVFQIVDRKPSIRQLYEIAELDKPTNEPTRTPLYMRLLVAPEQPRIAGDALDFRDEVMAQIYDRGDPTPKRTLTFHVEITDDGETHGTAIRERRTFANWRRVGAITFDKAVVSYNGDFVLQIHHPTWRDDPNDPATATRVNERKVRS
jgi:hypothetical protein